MLDMALSQPARAHATNVTMQFTWKQQYRSGLFDAERGPASEVAMVVRADARPDLRAVANGLAANVQRALDDGAFRAIRQGFLVYGRPPFLLRQALWRRAPRPAGLASLSHAHLLRMRSRGAVLRTALADVLS